MNDDSLNGYLLARRFADRAIKQIWFMGAHHFKFHLIPIGHTRTIGSDGEPVGDLLISYKFPESTVEAFRSLLPKVDRWGTCEELLSGSEWGSDIRIYREPDGTISDVGVRFSAVTESIEFLKRVLDLTRGAGCAIVIDWTTDVYSADFEIVADVLREHRSSNFLSSPSDAVRQAAEKTDQSA